MDILGRLDFAYPLLIKLLFENIYIVKYHYYWSYLGTTYNPNYEKAVISWVVAIIFAIMVKICARTKLSALFGVLVNISAIPSLSIYWLKNQSSEAFWLIVLYWSIWWFCTFVLSSADKKKDGWNCQGQRQSFIPDINNTIVLIVYIWTVVTTLYLSMRYGGLRLFIDLGDVYTYRLSGVSMSSIEGYIFAWNTNALLPILFGVHYLQDRKILFCSDMVLMLLSYGIFGNKSMLMTIPLVFGVIILHRMDMMKHFGSMIGVFIAVYVVASFFVPSQMFVALGDRILDGPAAGHYNYYDFFSNHGNPLLYLRESILRAFANSPYEQGITRIIGSSAKYYSGAYNNMNNGLFSMAYANFGIAGVIVQPIIIVVTFHLFCKLLEDYDDVMIYILALIHALFLISTSYFSWLITGGLVIDALVLFAIRRYDFLRLYSKRVRLRI